MRYSLKTILTMVLLLTLAGCGGDVDKIDDSLAPGKFVADSFLPGTLSGIALQTMTVLKTRSKVVDYVGSMSENYFAYHLVGMAAAVYEANGIRLSTEIAQFETETEAYGFYARIRPDNARLAKLGAEAYFEGNSLYFTQSNFAVTLSASGEDSTVTDVLNRLAVTISAEMGPAGGIPREFALFPRDKQIRASYRYFPTTRIGIESIHRVFTSRYAFARDTVTLFLTRDEQGLAYLATKESLDMEMEVGDEPAQPKFGFDEDFQLMFERSDHGLVVAGLAGGYFIGAYNFDEAKHGPFLKAWLAALKAD